MRIDLTRTFHPVGQGAFYTEEFNNFDEKTEEKKLIRIAYDCGGSNKPLMKKYIINDNNFKKDLHFNAVFISHLDRDHINGLEFLLSHCKVDKIFIPLLTPNEKIYLFSKYLSDIEETEDDIELLNNLFFENSVGEINIYRFRKSETPPERDDENYINISEDNISNVENGNVLNNKQIKLNKNWIFLPFNLNNEKFISKFITKINNVFPDLTDESIKELTKDKNNLEKLKKIYSEIFIDDINLSNLIIYSGFDYNSMNRRKYHHHCRYAIHNNFRFYCYCHPEYCCCANCMYFGDFKSKNNTNWDQFESYYKNYWDKVGIVQIPHHGSWYDYNEEINLIPKLSLICSNPDHKKYKHPHKETLVSILENGGIPLLVTKDINTKKVFEYSF